jgi:Ran GTPase-activating protein (RanGAP) involved in mRNA processing and transport
MEENQPVILCPIRGVVELLPCDFDELNPVLEGIRTGVLPEENLVFPRGTLTADGRLDMCKQNLGPEGCAFVVEALWNADHIHSLLLGTDGIGDAGAKMVADLVRHNSNIRTVYLGCNSIGAEGVAHLSAALSDNKGVSGLWLKRNPVGAEGAAHIAGLLHKNTGLKTLDLVNTGIHGAGLALICSVLAYTNRTLERLYLGGNDLNAADAGAIAEMLVNNPTLHGVFLSVNRLGDESAEPLAAALAQNTTLRELGLGSCGFGDAGLSTLFNVLAVHPALEYLDLSLAPSTPALNARNNTFGREATAALIRLLDATPCLRTLNLQGAAIPNAAHETIAEALLRCAPLQKIVWEAPVAERLGRLRKRKTPGIAEEVRSIKSVYR